MPTKEESFADVERLLADTGLPVAAKDVRAGTYAFKDCRKRLPAADFRYFSLLRADGRSTNSSKRMRSQGRLDEVGFTYP